MSNAEKIILAIIALAVVTTLVMSGRNTAGVISASTSGISNMIKTAMGR